MEIDITTLNDLNILGKEDNYSLFEKINFARTSNGEIQLQQNLSKPFNNVADITGIQETLKVIISTADQWPLQISNGTILMVEKFYDSNIDTIPENPSAYQTYLYKLLHSPDFSLIKYSVSHFFDLIKGLDNIYKLLVDQYNALPLQQLLLELSDLLNKNDCKIICNKNSSKEFSNKEILKAGYFFLYRYKHQTKKLLQLHAQLDAWYGMAMAVQHHQLIFPEIQKSDQPFIYAEDLYHLLLEKPISYDIKLDKEKNFMFLTGANMAGKSTFIKSTGTAVYLAHLGMGVPAKNMKLSFTFLKVNVFNQESFTISTN